MSFWEFVACLPSNLAMAICNDEPLLKWVKVDWRKYRYSKATRRLIETSRQAGRC